MCHKLLTVYVFKYSEDDFFFIVAVEKDRILLLQLPITVYPVMS